MRKRVIFEQRHTKTNCAHRTMNLQAIWICDSLCCDNIMIPLLLHTHSNKLHTKKTAHFLSFKRKCKTFLFENVSTTNNCEIYPNHIEYLIKLNSIS